MKTQSKRKRFIINGKEYTSARSYVENETEYLFSQYNMFRTRTGISINSDETAEKFVKWMEEGNFKYRLDKISPIGYNGVIYTKLGKLLIAIGSSRSQYISLKNNKGVTITKQEDLQPYLDYMKEQKKNKPISIIHNNTEYKSLKKLINALGYVVPQYAWYRTSTGKNVRNSKDVVEFVEFMESKGREKLAAA